MKFKAREELSNFIEDDKIILMV